MPVLKNARHERFIQGVVKGISGPPIWSALMSAVVLFA